METNKKAIAIGNFIIAAGKLSSTRGGNQKVQKIAGKGIYYQGENGRDWFYNNKAIKEMSISELNKLTEKIEEA